MPENVLDENTIERELEGYRNRLSGLEKPLREDSCSLTGFPRRGPLASDTTRVTDIEVDPVESVATKLNVIAPTSPEPGAPESVRLRLSRCSQYGAPDRAYLMIGSVEVKVDAEKTKLNA